MAEPTGEEVFGHELGGVGVVLEHAGELQMGTPEAEIDGRLIFALDELRQFVPGPQPGEDAVPFPTPGDDLFAGEVCGEKPGVFLSVFFDAAMEPVVVPAEGDQDAFMFLL
jgi:hypothetical protein